MDFYQIITLLFSFLGLMNGLFAAGLFRLKRFYLYGIAGALISCGAVQYYVWYALAYPEYGWAAHFSAYFACALMAADIMLILPFFLLMMIGTVRFIRRYAQIFGAAVMALSASYLRAPRPGEVVPCLQDVLKAEMEKGKKRTVLGPQLTRKEAMRTWKWYALWWIFFTNITCGIGLLAVVSPMAQDVIGMAPPEAASFVGIIGVVNGGGRIFWSTVSAWIGRGMTYIIFFAFEVFAFYRLSEITDSFTFQFLVLAVISCYGGGFSCMPAFLSDIFGVRQLAAIHGSILTAWGIAGIAGPVILALMKEATGSYSATLSLFSGMLALAFLISLLIHWQNETERKKWSVSAGNN